ncbi:MAG: hypothetical protein IPF75_03360 [Bacteroidetes bacterium]|nr:hypothetical protein [Bacteroidota bacterium]
MKKLLLLLNLLFISILGNAQGPYENDWIRYNQEYYKIKIAQEGIYRIGLSTLTQAGFSAASLDPRKIQLFHNGQEVAIYLEGENDGSFDAADFIEFYGTKNDGSLDTKLYADPLSQPAIEFSIANDTSVYFLTYNPTANGLRLSLVNDNNYSSYTPSDYFIREVYKGGIDVPNWGTYFGYNRGRNQESIEYTESEGWGAVFGNFSAGNYPITFSVPTANIYSSGPDIHVTTTVGGVNNLEHNFTLTYQGNNYADTVYYAQTLRRLEFFHPATTFTSPTTDFTYSVSTTPATVTDYSMMYSLYVKYPHTWNLEGSSSYKLQIPDASGQAMTRADITNFNGGTSPILYDLTNNKRILVNQSGPTYQTLIGNNGSSTPKVCYLTNSSLIGYPSVSKISYIQNNLGYFNDYNSMAVDSAFLIITNRGLWNQARTYEAHRDLTENNRALLIDVAELYDQFAYGINNHPLGIKNFSRWLLDTWTVAPPAHMFILGKSISSADFRMDQAQQSLCLVASYGVPPSDMLFTAGINGSIWAPKIPIGRISAVDGTEILNYLDKVIEYEAAQAGPPQPWMKEILHFGGGNNIPQQNQLAGYLSSYEQIMEDSAYGGHVTTYLKDSPDPIIVNLSTSLQQQIDTGVSIMTFFGHASGAGFDNSTDEPTAYSNRGRYPVIIANSCFAGDFHTYRKSVSEKFVLEPQKAAIAFLASVGQGVPNFLDPYSRALFENTSHRHYGSTIGQLVVHTIKDLEPFGSEGYKIVSQEMSLQGDPSLRFNSFQKPDYSVIEPDINFTPLNISTDIDSFGITISTRNLGKAVADSFIVKVTRTFPDNVDSVYTFNIGNCYYSSTINFNVATGGFAAAGLNRITVHIDQPDSVDEYDNLFNNTATTQFFITSKDIVPVYPPKYAIHPFNTVTLKGSTSNPFAPMNAYKFEIDTIDLDIKDATPGAQTSPMYRFTTVTDSGGVIAWSPQGYTLQDSAVYFWRVANDSIQYDTATFKWQQSSFQYISGKTGWSQSHFDQFKEDKFTNITYDHSSRTMDYVFNNFSLRVTTVGQPNASNFNTVGYYFNNSPQEYDGCQVTPAVMVAILDSISLQPITTCGNNFGQANQFIPNPITPCGSGNVVGTIPGCNRTRPENYFIYRYSSPSQMASFDSLMNAVPNGNYILLYSWFTDNYSAVDPLFYNAITSLGFNTGSLPDNTPYAYFLQKGFPSTKIEVHSGNPTDSIELTTVLTSHWNRGSITSTTLGPSTNWESLHWNQRPKESQPFEDSISVSIYGLNAGLNVWDLLKSGIQYQSGKDTTLNWIDATIYPYIRLETFTQDDSLKTPAQLTYWRVYHTEVPECALNANYVYDFHNNPLTEGDTIRLSFGIENLSNISMDNLPVKFYMYDKSRTLHSFPNIFLDSLRSNQQLVANLVIDTTFGYSGNNSLWIDVNPFGTDHLPEKYHFNNVAEIKFKVERDNINPILDVTFDGIHILNGDVVSGKPEIVVQLHDENKFLALNDSTKFKLSLTTPNSSTPLNLSFSSPIYGDVLRFTPAVLPKNSCKVNWSPTLADDGIYTIDVSATDKSLNASGKYNYKIQFEVINKSTITEVLNYPNPFSTATRFVFTLTGNEIPTHMKIQIMTISGKIVREIMLNELGNIHVGRNITEYAWDGKDEFGDQLANGLYLYRVVTNLNGMSIEKRETEADKYFKKGWGKMYLMR